MVVAVVVAQVVAAVSMSDGDMGDHGDGCYRSLIHVHLCGYGCLSAQM